MAGTDDNSSDDDQNNNNPDPQEVQPGAVPSLDETHARAVAGIEAEDANANQDDDSEADTGDGGDGDQASGTDDDSADEADADGADDDQDQEEDEPDVAPQPPAKPADTPTETAPELDTDIHKDGPDKIAIKTFDGETLYFNNMDEIPEDFEPSNYKEMMRAARDFDKKEASDSEAAADRAKEASDKAVAERQAQLNESWDKDIDVLVKGGDLPKDAKERDKAVDEVFTYMETELNAGRSLDNFAAAYWAVQGQKAREAAKNKDKETADTKKNRGSLIQGGSGGQAPDTSRPRTRIIEGPPAGVSLEQVHEKATRDLK